MPLSAAEAVEYDIASRAVAGWLFPGDLARIQVAIEQVRVSRGRLLAPRGNHPWIHSLVTIRVDCRDISLRMPVFQRM